HAHAALLALVAALAAGGSDTVASEMGQAWGKSTFLVTTFGRVKPGTPGGMSREGTGAGMLAAAAPAGSGVAGGLVPAFAIPAVGATPREPWFPSLLAAPLIGSAMAALLNAGNNALNQIYDLEIDRINKPKRPLPSGRLTIPQVWLFTNVTYAVALVLAWLVAPAGRHECFWLVAVAVVRRYIYSVPPLRTKRLGLWANVTIA